MNQKIKTIIVHGVKIGWVVYSGCTPPGVSLYLSSFMIEHGRKMLIKNEPLNWVEECYVLAILREAGRLDLDDFTRDEKSSEDRE